MKKTKADLKEEIRVMWIEYTKLMNSNDTLRDKNVSLHNQLVHEKKNHVEYLERLGLEQARSSCEYSEKGCGSQCCDFDDDCKEEPIRPPTAPSPTVTMDELEKPISWADKFRSMVKK